MENEYLVPILVPIVIGLLSLLVSYLFANSVNEIPGKAVELAKKRKYMFFAIGVIFLVITGITMWILNKDGDYDSWLVTVSVFLIYPIVYLLGGYLVATVGRANLSKFSTIFFDAQNNN